MTLGYQIHVHAFTAYWNMILTYWDTVLAYWDMILGYQIHVHAFAACWDMILGCHFPHQTALRGCEQCNASYSTSPNIFW